MSQTAVLDYVGISHIGHVRQENQDVWKVSESLGAFMLADGMGGRKGGKLAAQITVETFSQYLEQHACPEDISDAIKISARGIKVANQAVFEKGQRKAELVGMGTTLAALWILQSEAVCIHVGDSRIYCLRDHKLVRLTKDHTVVGERLGQDLTESSKHILSRAIGIGMCVEPAIESYTIQPGDLFMLCTDGLTNAISEKEIGQILMEDLCVDIKAKLLMQSALNLGGKDNVTLILAQLR